MAQHYRGDSYYEHNGYDDYGIWEGGISYDYSWFIPNKEAFDLLKAYSTVKGIDPLHRYALYDISNTSKKENYIWKNY